MASGKESSVQECEEYIEHHGIQAALKDAVSKLCQDRPPTPFKFLKEYFEKLEKVIYSSNLCTLYVCNITIHKKR